MKAKYVVEQLKDGYGTGLVLGLDNQKLIYDVQNNLFFTRYLI